MKHTRFTELRYPRLRNGLTLALSPACGPSGSVLRDGSRCRNHGALTNMDPATDWVVKSGAHALDFDGSNDEVVVAGNVQGCDGAIRATLSGWFGRDSSADTVGFGFANSLTSRFSFIWYSNDTLYLSCSSGTDCIATFSLSGTGRHHVAMVFNGSQSTGAERLLFYLNGQPQTWTLFSGTIPTSLGTYGTTFRLGKDYDSRFCGGYISEALFHARNLTPQEIRILARRPGILYDVNQRRRAPFVSAAPIDLTVNSLQCNAENSTVAASVGFGLTSNSSQCPAQNSTTALTVAFEASTNSSQCASENSAAAVAVEFGPSINSAQCSAQCSTPAVTIEFGLAADSGQSSAQASSDSASIAFGLASDSAQCSAQGSTVTIDVDFAIAANDAQSAAQASTAAISVDFAASVNSAQCSAQASSAAVSVDFSANVNSAQCAAENAQVDIGGGIDLEVNSLDCDSQGSPAALAVVFGLVPNSVQSASQNSQDALTVSFSAAANSGQCASQGSQPSVSIAAQLAVNCSQCAAQNSLCNVTLSGRRRTSSLFLQGGLFPGRLFLNG